MACAPRALGNLVKPTRVAGLPAFATQISGESPMNLSSKNRTRTLLAVWTAALWLGTAGGSVAGTLSYSIMFSESRNVLEHPANKTVAHMAAWTTQHSLMLKRTMPYVELRNTSAEGEITEFTMTIGDESKNFDWAALIEASPGVTFSLESPDILLGNLKTDVLKIDFSGLTPGRFVRFRTRLSADNPNLSRIVDYRDTFFRLNGGDTSDNSQITVAYQTATGPTSHTDTLPDFVNPMPTVTSLRFRSHYMDNVMPYASQFSTTAPPVPEPASVALLGMGLIALAAWKLRRTY
jgi:hypothetical protein